MFLTASKQFEFSIAHRYAHPKLSDDENRQLFGYDFQGPYGHGHNLKANIIIQGPLQFETGMMMNLSNLKKILLKEVISTLDHFYLNQDLDFFQDKIPTFPCIASYILQKSKKALEKTSVIPIACHLQESWEESATVFQKGHAQKTLAMHFIYPVNLTLHLVFQGPLHPLTQDIITQYDFLKTMTKNEDIQDILSEKGYAIDQEVLKKAWAFLKKSFPLLKKIVVTTDPMLTYEISDSQLLLSVGTHFRATHCLLNPEISKEENEALFGYCTRPHGHQFEVQATIDCLQPEFQSNTPLPGLLKTLFNAWTDFLLPYECCHLNDVLGPQLATCENILHYFINTFEKKSTFPLHRLRLNETRSNRFSLRKVKPEWM